MPVSSPSYFPPNRANGTIVGITAGSSTTGARNFLGGKSAGAFTTQSDLIALGDSALSAGTLVAPLTDANSQGTIVIGSGAATKLTNFTGGPAAGPATIIGWKANAQAVGAGASVMLGDRILQAWNAGAIGAGANTLIGSQIGSLMTGSASSFSRNTIIGTSAFASAAGNQDATSNVVIGAFACLNTQTNGVSQFANNVVIGDTAANNATSAQQNVLIGTNNSTNISDGIQNVAIGSSTSLVTHASNNVVIGTRIGVTGNNNTVIGDQSGPSGGSLTGARNVFLGNHAGANLVTGVNDIFYLQTFTAGGAEQGLIYGNFANGSVLIGNAAASQATLGAAGVLNILMIANGAKQSAGSPGGGGYFYVSAGALHWVGSSGTDTTVAAA